MYSYENPEIKPAKPEKQAKPARPAKAVKRMLVFFMVIFLMLSPVVSVTGAAAEADQEAKTGWQAYDGKRIGVLTGTPLENIAAENFPNSE